VVNQEYLRGQTSSLQRGLKAVATDQPDAVMLCLVDHPAVSAEVIAKLKQNFESIPAPVIIPTYKGEHGHPVVISKALFPELLALSPGEPANTVIRKYHPETQFLEVADRGILIDVDEPRTYERLEESGR
jgi:CTP:molybdopterin cytidylyltransferase MocA